MKLCITRCKRWEKRFLMAFNLFKQTKSIPSFWWPFTILTASEINLSSNYKLVFGHIIVIIPLVFVTIHFVKIILKLTIIANFSFKQSLSLVKYHRISRITLFLFLKIKIGGDSWLNEHSPNLFFKFSEMLSFKGIFFIYWFWQKWFTLQWV